MVSQKVLTLDADGKVERVINVPHGVCGQVFVDGFIYLVTTDDEETTDYWLTRVDPRPAAPKIDDLVRIRLRRGHSHLMADDSGPIIASKTRSCHLPGSTESVGKGPKECPGLNRLPTRPKKILNLALGCFVWPQQSQDRFPAKSSLIRDDFADGTRRPAKSRGVKDLIC
jgi:hypothetical protein